MLNAAYEQGLSALDERMCQRWKDLDIARDVFYFDCDEPTATAALRRLRPQSVNPALVPFTLTEHPRVPTTYVVCNDDRMLRPEWSRHAVRVLIDADMVELPGGHSPMLSQPQVLADLLLRV
jgi:pimeloyl-ACP methyl ester carboxylesterase